MQVSLGSVCKAGGRAKTFDLRLAIILLERVEGATAPGLAIGSLGAHKAVAQVVSMRAARQNVGVRWQCLGGEHLLEALNTVLKRIHIGNG